RKQTRSFKTLFGVVTLKRQGYGGRGQESLHPLDAQLQLPPEKLSYPLQRRVAEAAAKESFDETLATVKQQTGVGVPKWQAELAAQRAAQDFPAFYARQAAHSAEAAATTSEILVVTCDGKGVPMLKDDLLPATRAAAADRQPRLPHRRSKGEKAHTKRMSTVAAVYTIAPQVRTAEDIVRGLQPVQGEARARPRPEDKRVWASLKQPPEKIIEQAFDEAQRRDPQRSKKWVALVDGNETQLGLLLCAAKSYGVKLEIVLDVIHVLEYWWKAAWCLHEAGDGRADAWVSQRLADLLRGRSALVAAAMRRSATLRKLSTRQRAPLDKCADYLLKYGAFLHYDRYLAAGYPIASGVIEGACRYLVKDRMERTGARWRLDSAEAVLQLRALRASGDFEAYWEFHLEQEYQRHHQRRYFEGRVPTPKAAAVTQSKEAGSAYVSTLVSTQVCKFFVFNNGVFAR
ncbi:MAG: ISKra4 family transposase, partial [Acidobacteria bacterium]|nr:ISKra4 family transposase [Acidobacteriota bacterium]